MKLKPGDDNLTFRRYLFLKMLYYYENKFINIPFDRCFHFNCDNNRLSDGNDKIDIVSVAFNNDYVIQLQIKYIRKFITDSNYTFLVADNSDDPEKQKAIQDVCKKENVGYVCLPEISKKFSRKFGSYSHGTALNWIYYNYVDKRKPDCFALLDHDIFPTQSVSIKSKIGSQGFYGYKRTSDDFWFLWPGLLFFDYKQISHFQVNFLPMMKREQYLDTGGSLYNAFYSRLDDKEFFFPELKRVSLTELGYTNTAQVDFIDNNLWFHSANASYWRKVDPYMDLIEEIINKHC